MDDPEDLMDSDEDAWADIPVPAELTPELFALWRVARRGSGNPERMNNPLWEWLVASHWSAFQIADHFDPERPMPTDPGWCFRRFGQSNTLLADGRRVLIGGEHEDHYDPDFYIYNDVVIQEPSGATQILGYPVEVFPPTDSHTATLVGDRIILVGCLGYPDQRRVGVTQVLCLATTTFAFSSVETSGEPPGWIFGHQATLTDDAGAIIVRGGKLELGRNDVGATENIDEWQLDLRTWIWTRLTERQWERWELRRADGRWNHLWEIELAMFSAEMNWKEKMQEALENLAGECGRVPDLAIASELYHPSISHEHAVAEGETPSVTRIQVQGVIVRYVQGMREIQMTVEGKLPAITVEALKADLLRKFEALENSPCAWSQL